MARDPEYGRHQEWLGFIQPVGLVVSAPALCAAQAHIDANGAVRKQQLFRELFTVIFNNSPALSPKSSPRGGIF